MVFGVDHEDDAAYFGEVVFPEAAGWLGGFSGGGGEGWGGGGEGWGYLVGGRRGRRL